MKSNVPPFTTSVLIVVVPVASVVSVPNTVFAATLPTCPPKSVVVAFTVRSFPNVAPLSTVPLKFAVSPFTVSVSAAELPIVTLLPAAKSTSVVPVSALATVVTTSSLKSNVPPFTTSVLIVVVPAASVVSVPNTVFAAVFPTCPPKSVVVALTVRSFASVAALSTFPLNVTAPPPVLANTVGAPNVTASL